MPVSQPAATLPGGRAVLLCEDDPDVQAFVASCLGELGCRVLPTANGAAALALLKGGETVDLLVTDFAMPGMSGGALVKGARALRPGLPALLITGYADAAVLKREAEGVLVLTKPFKPTELTELVAQLLTGRVTA